MKALNAGSNRVASLRRRWLVPDGRRRDGDRDKKSEAAEPKLLNWVDLPHWQQHGSELIHTGYRQASGSALECLKSWSYIHNETVNIYSHILGAAVFFCLPVAIFAATIPPRLSEATHTEVLVCTIYLVGVAVCFVLSTCFHTFMSHSHHAYLLGMKLDFQGILLLMWSSTIPLIYHSFPCHPRLRMGYGIVTSILAVLCSAATFLPVFSSPHLGPYRALLFGSFGLGSFVAPIAHGILLHGLETQGPRIGLGWIGATVVCNGLGVVAYTFKFPEKWFPRRFDFFGASHQIMHVMVVCAALTYTMSMVEAFDFQHTHKLMC
ncbi:hemolysin-III channel protein-like protein Izh2 [Thozetella sp. PMI_491]|nr:hemolysin-III channel protein-like protein Izh2 [Thozetella sp. PMI_491]